MWADSLAAPTNSRPNVPLGILGESRALIRFFYEFDWLTLTHIGVLSRYRPKFFDQVGYQPISAYIFSQNHVIVRPTKIINNLIKICKICIFKVIFRHQNSTESFWIFFSVKNIWLDDQLLLTNFLKTFLKHFVL